MNLIYQSVQGNNIPVVYKGSIAGVFLHASRFEDGAKLTAHDSNLQLLDQRNFLNMPKTQFEYRNEVVTRLLLEEAQALARPHTISPLQHELMIWNY